MSLWTRRWFYKNGYANGFTRVTSLVLAFLFAFSSPFSLAIANAQTGTLSPAASQPPIQSVPQSEQTTKSTTPTLGSGDAALQAVIQATNDQGQTTKTTTTTVAPQSQAGSSDKKTTTSQPSGGNSGPVVSPFTGGTDAPPHPEREAIISQVRPDQTGALNYQIPIVVPPGRTKATTPDLSLTYSSRNGEDVSPFGYGWSVNIPYIERENKLGTNNLYSRNDFMEGH